MKFGYTIHYVENVPQTVEFYEKAFGVQRRFLHESNTYAEMETGATALAFASLELGRTNAPALANLKKSTTIQPFEIAFVTDDVEGAYRLAIENGAAAIKAPTAKPWGQVVAYVTDLNGNLVELCSPMG